MPYTFTAMNEADARAIQAWRYEGIYTIYNLEPDDDPAEMLDRRSPHYAARNERGELVGFFAFGTSAEIEGEHDPALYRPDRSITVGLGLRPDLTGKGLGLSFVEAGLAFAREQFAPGAFRLFVLTFNERAIRVYERAAFQRVGVVLRDSPSGERAFLEMLRPS